MAGQITTVSKGWQSSRSFYTFRRHLRAADPPRASSVLGGGNQRCNRPGSAARI